LRAGRRVTSKTELIERLYGTGADVGESAIEALVSRLRKKLAPSGLEIRMQRNLGYVLQERDR
jgi:DNA-binding response OmpR family regulator